MPFLDTRVSRRHNVSKHLKWKALSALVAGLVAVQLTALANSMEVSAAVYSGKMLAPHNIIMIS